MPRILALIPFIFFSCVGSSDRISDQNEKTEVESKGFEVIKDLSCSELISQLVKSSNATAFKHFGDSAVHARVDHLTADKITIKLYVIDISDRTGSERTIENAVGWLEFYRQGNKLMDITDDRENPKELQYDRNLIGIHDIFDRCSAVSAIAKSSTSHESGDVMLENDILFNGTLKRYFTLTEFEKVFGKPDSIRLLIDEAPCTTIFGTEAPEDKYLYKNGSRFETSRDSVAVDEYRFQNGNFITYKGYRIDEGTTMEDIERLFPTALKGRLGMDKEGKLWVIKLREDEQGISDGHIKLFFKNNKVYFMHWWFPC